MNVAKHIIPALLILGGCGSEKSDSDTEGTVQDTESGQTSDADTGAEDDTGASADAEDEQEEDEGPLEVCLDSDEFETAAGDVYLLDLFNGDWYAPEGFGPVLIPYLDYQLLIAVDVVDGQYTAQLAHTATESETQDFCIETPGAYSNPTLDESESDSVGVAFEYQGGAPLYTINRFVPTNPEQLGFTVDADTGAISGVSFAFELDAREINLERLLLTTDPDEVCETMVRIGDSIGFDLNCMPCMADEAPYCLNFAVRDIPATPTTEIVKIIGQGEVIRELVESAK